MSKQQPGNPVDADTGYEACYACGKCTSGCPTAGEMDIPPHRVMRLLQLGATQGLLAASGPWQCVGCQTCLARCPNQIDIPAALAQLRHEAYARGHVQHAGGAVVFDRLFLGMLRRHGRVNDAVVALRYKLRQGGLLKDWRLGLRMWRAGKLKLRASSVADPAELEPLFDAGREED
jgi:heterodisulfide reductase subunit C